MEKQFTDSNPDIHLRAPWLASGGNKYGASMGRRDSIPDDVGAVPVAITERMKYVDGDYDEGGAYWGSGGKPMFCAWGDSPTEQAEVYFRAADLRAAKAHAAKEFTGATIVSRRAAK